MTPPQELPSQQTENNQTEEFIRNILHPPTQPKKARGIRDKSKNTAEFNTLWKKRRAKAKHDKKARKTNQRKAKGK